MFFQRYYLDCLAHASYMIADEETKIAAVVDPQRDIDLYIEDAAARGFQIKYVFLTHFHADFVAGHIELREKTGASIYLGARAQAEYDFTPVREGDVVEFGKVRLSILETPGHTPEGISILVYDLTKSDRTPHAVLTGDTLFIGDVGRPDLLASIGVTADELAGMLYDSLHNKLMKLPDETLVYPAHGAGSMCGRNLSDEAVSTIGEQRRYNYALQSMSKDEFVSLMTADLPEAPDYFAHDAMMNRQDRPALNRVMQDALDPLELDQVLELQRRGAQIVDVREATDFSAGHLRGSINIALKGKYATWAGTILDRSRPIVVIADTGREEEAVMRLGRIGFDLVAGYLKNGLEALVPHPDLVERTQRMTAVDLAEQLNGETDPLIVDVRTEKEWQSGHVESSVNLPLNQLQSRADELPRDRRLVVHCQGGYRSAIATSLLLRHGFNDVFDMVGGFQAWRASKLPMNEPESQSA